MAYSITNILTNLTATGDTEITTTATVTLTAASGYRVPASVTVSGADYTYDDYTDITEGVITLSNPTGNVTITAVGLTEEERFNADMDGIADVINTKAGTTGEMYLPQIKRTAEMIVPLSSVPQKATATYTPTTSDQTIASGQYLAGAQTIEGIVCENLLPENIKAGVTVKIGTATDDDSVTTVTGTYQGGGDSITIEWSFEADGTYGGVAYQTPNMSTYDASTIYASFTTETGSFDLSETTITFWGWYKYNPQSITHLTRATYSINGGTSVDFSNSDINHPVTLTLNSGDVLTIDCYADD